MCHAVLNTSTNTFNDSKNFMESLHYYSYFTEAELRYDKVKSLGQWSHSR